MTWSTLRDGVRLPGAAVLTVLRGLLYRVVAVASVLVLVGWLRQL